MNVNIDDWPGWTAIFITGMGVIFSFGYKKSEIDELKKITDKHDQILSPDNSEMRIIKATDLARVENKIDEIQCLIIDILRDRERESKKR